MGNRDRGGTRRRSSSRCSIGQGRAGGVVMRSASIRRRGGWRDLEPASNLEHDDNEGDSGAGDSRQNPRRAHHSIHPRCYALGALAAGCEHALPTVWCTGRGPGCGSGERGVTAWVGWEVPTVSVWNIGVYTTQHRDGERPLSLACSLPMALLVPLSLPPLPLPLNISERERARTRERGKVSERRQQDTLHAAPSRPRTSVQAATRARTLAPAAPP
jgi:hypothetical protein